MSSSLQLTFDEWQKTQVFVISLSTVKEAGKPLSKLVQFKIVFEDEETILETRVKIRPNRTKQEYIELAFKKLRNQIVQFVKQQGAGAVVGIQQSFPIEYFNEESVVDE